MPDAPLHRRLEKLEAAVEQQTAADDPYAAVPYESIFDTLRRLAAQPDSGPPQPQTPEGTEESKQFWADLNEKLARRGQPPAYVPK